MTRYEQVAAYIIPQNGIHTSRLKRILFLIDYAFYRTHKQKITMSTWQLGRSGNTIQNDRKLTDDRFKLVGNYYYFVGEFTLNFTDQELAFLDKVKKRIKSNSLKLTDLLFFGTDKAFQSLNPDKKQYFTF